MRGAPASAGTLRADYHETDQAFVLVYVALLKHPRLHSR